MNTVMYQNYPMHFADPSKATYKIGLMRSVCLACLRSPVGATIAVGASMLIAPQALAQCAVDAAVGTVTCTADTVTLNLNHPTNGGRARHLSGAYNAPLQVTVEEGVDVSGMGLGVTNTGTGGVVVRNDGDIRIDTNPGPTFGPGFKPQQGGSPAKGSAALGIIASGGDISVTGSGNIDARLPHNMGRHSDALFITNGGSGTVTVDLSGAIFSREAAILVSDTVSGGDISVNLGADATVTGRIGVNSSSKTANLSLVTNVASMGIGISFLARGSGDIDMLINTNMNIFGGGSDYAGHRGTGSINIQATEHIRSDAGGIRTESFGGGDIKIKAHSIETNFGIESALYAEQHKTDGEGNIEVEATGTLYGRGGIYLYNGGLGTIRAVLHENISSRNSGNVGAVFYGRGDIDVLMHKNVTSPGGGVYVGNVINGTGDTKFTGLGDYHGQLLFGLNALNYGTGSIDVDLTGLVSSGGTTAFQVRDFFLAGTTLYGAIGGRMDVVAGSAQALGPDVNADGVEVTGMSANAAISLTVNGDVAANRSGVVAKLLSPDATGDIVVATKGDVTAATGVDGVNNGSGNVDITQAADTAITASNGHGIWAASQTGNTVVEVGG